MKKFNKAMFIIKNSIYLYSNILQSFKPIFKLLNRSKSYINFHFSKNWIIRFNISKWFFLIENNNYTYCKLK